MKLEIKPLQDFLMRLREGKLNVALNPAQIKEIFKQALLGKKNDAPVNEITNYLTCDLGKSFFILTEIQKTPSSVKLVRLQKIARPAPEKESDALQEAFLAGQFSTNKVRISMKGQGVIVRFIQFPQMKQSELKSALSYEIDQYIPFKSNEVVWDAAVLEENAATPAGGNVMNLMLTAVKHDEIYSIVQMFQKALLEIELVDVDAIATLNAFEFFYPEKLQTPVAILDIGYDFSTVNIVPNGKPRYIRDISYGIADITKKFKRKLDITEEQAAAQIQGEAPLTPDAEAILKESLLDLVSDLKVSISYYFEQNQGAQAVKTLMVGGIGGHYPLLREILQAHLDIPIEKFDILSKIEIGEGVDPELVKSHQGLLPVAIGLAVRPL